MFYQSVFSLHHLPAGGIEGAAGASVGWMLGETATGGVCFAGASSSTGTTLKMKVYCFHVVKNRTWFVIINKREFPEESNQDKKSHCNCRSVNQGLPEGFYCFPSFGTIQ